MERGMGVSVRPDLLLQLAQLLDLDVEVSLTLPREEADVQIPPAGNLADRLPRRAIAMLAHTLGALVAISSLVSLARPDVSAAVWATSAFGVLLFVAPWVVGYAGLTGPAWTSWLVGVLVVVVSQTVVGPFSGHSRRAIQH